MDSVMCRGFCKETQNSRHITTPLLAALGSKEDYEINCRFVRIYR
jgi:hypothetical protein